MTGDLYINGTDAYAEWGVSMAKGFVSALDAPAPMKDYVKNVSRAEHGSRYVVPTGQTYLAERELTLGFIIQGADEAEFRAHRAAFIAELQKGRLTLSVPQLTADVFRLIYTGKSISYSLNQGRTLAKMQAKFTEPDPTDRAAADEE